MTTVTVCVPAYRSGPPILHALRSLQRQTHRDILVRVACEPPAEETLDLIAPFLADSRFEVYVNPLRLGWDANIRGLLSKIVTPMFMVLPHDDVLHYRAIEILLRQLEQDPDASVAYGDMHVFGDCKPFRKLVDLPRHASREGQILAFFLASAEAVPWRGVTRSSVISRAGGFPVDGFKGFAVECEWALRLLVQGTAIRVPRRLYFKRIQDRNVHSASRERVVDQTPDQLAAAWARHRGEMLAMLSQAIPPEASGRQLVHLAAELAMLRRLTELARLPLSGHHRASARQLAEQADAVATTEPLARDLAVSFWKLASEGVVA